MPSEKKPLNLNKVVKEAKEPKVAKPKTRKSKRRWGKYGAKTCFDEEGVSYHSMAEREVLVKLKLLLKGGYIENLITQKEAGYNFVHNKEHICSYWPDAKFDVLKEFALESKKGMVVFPPGKGYVLDVKSAATVKDPVYALKKKMMRVFYGIQIIEVLK